MVFVVKSFFICKILEMLEELVVFHKLILHAFTVSVLPA